MSSTRNTLGSIFAAIQGLAIALLGLFKAADKGIQMLDAAVGDAQERQTIRSAVDMAVYKSQFVAEQARRLDESRKAINEYASRSPEHEKGYQNAFDELMEAVERRQKKLGISTKIEVD